LTLAEDFSDASLLGYFVILLSEKAKHFGAPGA
jgi:hypothetical protein